MGHETDDLPPSNKSLDCVHTKRHVLEVVVTPHRMEVSGQIQALSTSAAGKDPLVSVKHEVGWATDPVWTFWRTENSFATAGKQTMDYPASSLATLVSELSHLHLHAVLRL